jgi:hypothetical protein
MNTKKQCCGNCELFTLETVIVRGVCEYHQTIMRCDEVCEDHIEVEVNDVNTLSNDN